MNLPNMVQSKSKRNKKDSERNLRIWARQEYLSTGVFLAFITLQLMEYHPCLWLCALIPLVVLKFFTMEFLDLVTRVVQVYERE